MKFFIFFIFIGLSFSTEAQTNDLKQEQADSLVCKLFIEQLANPNIAVDIILSQQVIVDTPSNELYDYLEISLEEIRLNLVSKNINDIKYLPFLEAPKKETKDIDLEELNPEKAYLLFYKNKQILALYIERNSIASFTLVSKGNGKAHFVLY